MAPRLRYGIALVAAVCLWITDAELPPESLPARRAPRRDAVAARYSDLGMELGVTDDALRRWAWSDRLGTLLDEADGGLVVESPDGSADTPSFEALRARVRSDVAALDSRDMGVTFGFVVLTSGEDPSRGRRPQRYETYVGEHEGRAYCIQAAPMPQVDPVALVEQREEAGAASLVGACAPFLRHGLAGPSIAQWLESGATGLLDARDARTSWSAPRMARLDAFGRWSRSVYHGPIEVDQCLAGRVEGCRALLLLTYDDDALGVSQGRAVARRSPALSVGGPSPFTSWLPESRYVLEDLETEFGPEAFGRFWTSSDDVETAFQDAFGVDAGVWFTHWITNTVGVTAPGPGLPKSASTGTLLTIAVLLGLAFARHRRRAVA